MSDADARTDGWSLRSQRCGAHSGGARGPGASRRSLILPPVPLRLPSLAGVPASRTGAWGLGVWGRPGADSECSPGRLAGGLGASGKARCCPSECFRGLVPAVLGFCVLLTGTPFPRRTVPPTQTDRGGGGSTPTAGPDGLSSAPWRPPVLEGQFYRRWNWGTLGCCCELRGGGGRPEEQWAELLLRAPACAGPCGV